MKSINKLLALLIILALSLSMLFSCDIKLEDKDEPEKDTGGTTTDTPTDTPVKLGTPNLTVNGDTVSWTAIADAVGYEISVDGVIEALSKSTLSYTAGKTCEVKVRAVGDGKTTSTGSWSIAVTLDFTLDALGTPNISVDGDIASWSAVEGAVGYELNLSGNYVTVGADVLSYTLSSGDVFCVRAIGDGITFRSGSWSAKVSVDGEVHSHTDGDNNDLCDSCGVSVIVVIDFYAINDLHGKFCDTDTQPGVDELGTYLTNAKETDDYTIFLSSGDMWQGSAESNLTGGFILTEWMNEMGFVSMTLGNHEFDWGEEVIKNNLAVSDFPFLAINIYDNSTGERVDYCEPSIMVDLGDVQVGIIGAIGNCYSSISSDRVENVHFKTGDALTALIKAESQRLKEYGADFIVLSYHDEMSYLDSVNLFGYVDIIFEGHTHQAYKNKDSQGIWHLQGGGENNGITHAEISLNSVNGTYVVNTAEVVGRSIYSSLPDCEKTEALEEKYSEVIEKAYSPLGTVSIGMASNDVEDYVAGLYLEAALERWGDEYNIVLGGGYLKTRSPYDLPSGSICYADVLSLFPFDNRLVLCSIKGSTLKSKFINPTGDYHTVLSDYGNSIKGSIKDSETYYIIVDTYTQLYPSNYLTAIEYYDDGIYARDLLADAISEGRLGSPSDGSTSDGDTSDIYDNYSFTEITELLELGKELGANKGSNEYYLVTGTVTDTPQSTYGNLTLTDESGNTIYVYGLYDLSGTRYDSMSTKPRQGDTIVVLSQLYHYYNSATGEDKLELKAATLVEIVK